MLITFWKDGSGRSYVAEMTRNGDYVNCGNLYRETMRASGRFTLYRESCHGKLPNHAKLAWFDAIATLQFEERKGV